MKNIILRSIVVPISTTILLITPVSAMALDRLDRFDLELNLGYRVDQFDWNIAGTSPNILSELTWDDLEIAEVSTKARIILLNKHYPFGGTIRARVNYGEIQAGDNQDSDYGLDNRTGEWSRSNNKTDDGDVLDLTVGGGLVFKSENKKFIVSPLLGFSYHAQNLTIHDGFQTISGTNPFDPTKSPPPVGPIAGLNSTYDAEWRSGWLGVDLEFQAGSTFELHGSIEFHAAEYEADANWNLRSDLSHPISFEHDADEATGIVSSLGAKYGLGNFLFNLDLRYQKWQAEDGINTVYFSDGRPPVNTRVNEVNWESFSISAGLTVRF